MINLLSKSRGFYIIHKNTKSMKLRWDSVKVDLGVKLLQHLSWRVVCDISKWPKAFYQVALGHDGILVFDNTGEPDPFDKCFRDDVIFTSNFPLPYFWQTEEGWWDITPKKSYSVNIKKNMKLISKKQQFLPKAKSTAISHEQGKRVEHNNVFFTRLYNNFVAIS